jgi:Contractile injection system tube protein
MPIPTGFQRAQLEIEGDAPIECWFNPKEYTISKSNQWKTKEITGTSLPPAQFGGGKPRELKLDLLFDGTSSETQDVRDATDRLFKMMESSSEFASNKNSGRPPMVTFGWGSVVSFKAVATSLSVKYVLFHPDGTPLRAQVNLSLLQAEEAVGGSANAGNRPQNPTTRSAAGLGTRTIRDGDSLPLIAFEYYGDPSRWRAIAEANDIDDPLALARGSELAIPRVEA